MKQELIQNFAFNECLTSLYVERFTVSDLRSDTGCVRFGV